MIRIEDKILTINQIKTMSQDELVSAYKNGYTLQDTSSNILKLGTSDCPDNIQQGTTKNITASMTSLGIPDYVYKLYIKESSAVDFTELERYPAIDTVPNTTPNTSHIFSHIFDEAVGSYIIKTDVVDNCTPVALTDESTCPVNIVLAAADICIWIIDLGGWESITAFDIMTLVSAYSGNTDVGFVVTAAHIMGCVAYYGASSPTNGNNLTGCEFT